jgi:hypothetical protein
LFSVAPYQSFPEAVVTGWPPAGFAALFQRFGSSQGARFVLQNIEVMFQIQNP